MKWFINVFVYHLLTDIHGHKHANEMLNQAKTNFNRNNPLHLTPEAVEMWRKAWKVLVVDILQNTSSSSLIKLIESHRFENKLTIS